MVNGSHIVLHRSVVVLVLAMLALAGCGDSSTSSDDIVNAVVEATFSPEPVVAETSTSADFQWLATFTITFTETAGTAATINDLGATVTETSGGIEVVSEEEELFQVSFDSETNEIPASSSVDIPVEVFYTLPGGGQEATIEISFSILDANGVEVGGTLEIPVE